MRKITELAQGDDRAEWEAFVELYTPPLTRFVRLQSPGSSEEEIEDVVQEVFVRLVAVLREGRIDRAKAKFRAYLATMTRRLLIDRYRAAQVRPHAAAGTEESTGGTESTEGTSSSTPEALDPGAAVDILWRMAVHDAAKMHVFSKTAISEQSRRIYVLLERGLSLREAAARVGVSYAAAKQVKSRIDRAIAAIERRYLET